MAAGFARVRAFADAGAPFFPVAADTKEVARRRSTDQLRVPPVNVANWPSESRSNRVRAELAVHEGFYGE